MLQLPLISTSDSVLDLVVIGCGPAGLSLAAESAKKGLKVGLIGPDLPFTNNYGVWEDEFKGNYSSRRISQVSKFTSVTVGENDCLFFLVVCQFSICRLRRVILLAEQNREKVPFTLQLFHLLIAFFLIPIGWL